MNYTFVIYFVTLTCCCAYSLNISCFQHLKRKLTRFFASCFFFMNQFPPAPEYPPRTISNFFENSRRYSQVKVHHRYQRHRQHRQQILSLVLLVLLIPVANLPPVWTIPAANLLQVSTTPVAIWHRYQRNWQQIWNRCQWHRWQIMGKISGCWGLNVSLKAKMYL